MKGLTPGLPGARLEVELVGVVPRRRVVLFHALSLALIGPSGPHLWFLGLACVVCLEEDDGEDEWDLVSGSCGAIGCSAHRLCIDYDFFWCPCVMYDYELPTYSLTLTSCPPRVAHV